MATAWANQTKNTATFTALAKNSASWSNQVKQFDFILREQGDAILREDGIGALLKETGGTVYSFQTKN